MLSNSSVAESVGPNALALARAIGRVDCSVSVLISGEDGAGQTTVARELAAVFLCLAPVEGAACGECAACGSLARGACPDLFLVTPGFRPRVAASVAVATGSAPTGGAATGDKSKQDLIVLRQIVPDKEPKKRCPNVRNFLYVGPVLARSKVVLVCAAERMNFDAGNALLKMLEEPPDWARFILTTSAASRLLPTVVSRCLLLPCDFAEGTSGEPAETLAAGAPSLAAALNAPELAGVTQAFGEWLEHLPGRRRAEALKVSEEFQDLCASYVEALPEEQPDERAARAAFVRLFANWLARSARGGDEAAREMLKRAIEMHRAILGNVRFEFLVDSLFAGSLLP